MTDRGVTAPLQDDPAPAQVTATETVFEGRVWNIRRDEVLYNGAPMVREYMDHTGAVAVLALDEQDRVLLIKQYRHPVRMRDWEIPAGLLDIAEEQPLRAAQRELAEEADLVADRWNVLAEFTTSPGGSDEAIRIYLARGLSAADEVFARTEEEADIEVRWVPLDEALDAVLARRVQNPSLVIGVLTAHAARARDWATLAAGDEPWPRRSRPIGDAGAPQA
ncbi:NUDIX domain-containing protein [Microbacterium telephonicum]|uniref:ADP-ribose pyrophosphatase n=1 Tax=Microbacterium telephonicum TaxID=1714841 RepID=A0A498C479_9MICO|nr:NUDIX hydrolase [Microbacterium telephonicum]RLK49739.1 ADP-ribose pyrophosphatase [Microbacterium telephonicum]